MNAHVDEESSMLAQLDDCTCLGYNQTFECTVFGSGFTIWQGTALSGCQRNEIQLCYCEYIDSRATGQCNGGKIVAKSVGRTSGNCFTSQLRTAVVEEIINETIECIHLQGVSTTVTVGQSTLSLTQGK